MKTTARRARAINKLRQILSPALLSTDKGAIYTGPKKVLCAGLVIAVVLTPRYLVGPGGARECLHEIVVEISAPADDPLLVLAVKNGLREITALFGHFPVRVHAQIRPLVTAGIRN